MIFVTVSLDLHPFTRLIAAMDELAGRIEEQVLIQGGVTYQARYADYVVSVGRQRAAELVGRARLVVAHAGIGTILTVFQHRKPLIIVPRRQHLGEHHTDHQLQVAARLEDRPGVRVVQDVSRLAEHLDFNEPSDFNAVGRDRLVGLIRENLDQWRRPPGRQR